MMQSMKYFINLFLIILFAAGCSNLKIVRNYTPIEFQAIQEIDLDFIPAKIIYSSFSNTLFVWQKGSNLIHIYKAEKQINIIGRMGSDQSNFSQLSDLALSPDDNLLALDSFQKKIKKYDREGKYITSFDLPDFSEPKLFDVAVDETFYIYDEFLNEIIATRDFTEKNWFSFGNQELDKPQNLCVAMNQIVLSGENSTAVFNTLGQLENNFQKICQIENGVLFSLHDNYIQHENSGNRFAKTVGHWNAFYIKNGIVLLTGENYILIGKFIYEVN